MTSTLCSSSEFIFSLIDKFFPCNNIFDIVAKHTLFRVEKRYKIVIYVDLFCNRYEIIVSFILHNNILSIKKLSFIVKQYERLNSLRSGGRKSWVSSRSPDYQDCINF